MATEDRGFASMDRNKQREIASKGGMASHRRRQEQPGKEMTGSAPEQGGEPVRQEQMIGGSSSDNDLIR